MRFPSLVRCLVLCILSTLAFSAFAQSGFLEITAGGLLSRPVIRAEIEDAWADAGFGTDHAHEEGGWIYRSVGSAGNVTYRVERWPAGPECTAESGCGITPSSPATIPGFELIAEFHIHPMPEYNAHGTPTGFLAEPSSADIAAAKDMELLGIVRNQYGYDPYNGYGCGKGDGCTGGERLALTEPGPGTPALAQSDRASSFEEPVKESAEY